MVNRRIMAVYQILVSLVMVVILTVGADVLLHRTASSIAYAATAAPTKAKPVKAKPAKVKPTVAAPSATPTEAAPSAEPTEAAPSAEPTEAAPSVEPTEAAPSATPSASGYAGSDMCLVCHQEVHENMLKTPKGQTLLKHPRTDLEARGCEACHGPGQAHVDAGGDPALIKRFSKDTDQAVVNGTCLQCHGQSHLTQWSTSTHAAAGLTCVVCHSPHKGDPDNRFLRKPDPDLCLQCHKEKDAQIHLPSHHPIIEGKLKCIDCHNPHGGYGRTQLKAETVNDLCLKCHAEKEGPFAFEHAPVTENCLICHTPHGSANNMLLSRTVTTTCLQCHNGVHSSLGAAVQPQTILKHNHCINCHAYIHGSDNNRRFIY